jgi:hypothetical protein
VLKVAASARAWFGGGHAAPAPAPAPGAAPHPRQQAATDVLLRTLLHPSVPAPAEQVQFLLALPPPAPPAAWAGAPLCRPAAAWSPPRAQLLWAVAEEGAPGGGGGGGGAGSGAHADAGPPRASTHFAPGRAAEFRARIPLAGGPPWAEGADAPRALPVQVRFALPAGCVAPLRLEDATQPRHETLDDELSGFALKVTLAAILLKGTSSVRALYKA